MAKAPKVNVLTDKQVEAFSGYVAKWQRELNMRDWRIGVSKKPPPLSLLAQVIHHLESRTATIKLNRHWGATNDCTAKEVERIAVHELLHVFFTELITLAQDKEASESTLASAEHRVIQTLVHVLVPD